MNIERITQSLRNRSPEPLKPYNYYSVMVPLIQQDDNFSVLFEVRSDALAMQPGEVCFPGGRQDEGESPQECAVRETCEELCISQDKIKLIGPIDYLNAYSNFTIYPFVGLIDHQDIHNVPFNHDEVQETFLVPLDFFLENEPLFFTFPVAPQIPNDFPYELINNKGSYNWRQGKAIIPIYNFESRKIWGLTARIIHNFVQIIREDI